MFLKSLDILNIYRYHVIFDKHYKDLDNRILIRNMIHQIVLNLEKELNKKCAHK